MLFTLMVTTTMIATGGFGAFPDNPLTQTFQTVISENVPADFLEPFNSYMENISAPTIPPQPASASENDSQPDPLGFLEDLIGGGSSAPTQLPNEAVIVETAMAAIEETQAQILTITVGASTPTATQVLTQTPTLTLVPTFTVLPSETPTLNPTATFPLVYIPPTATKNPPPEDTPTFTPSPVPLIGFNVSSVNFNGAGSSISVAPGALVTVTYNFDVFNDSCPGCTHQLVTGLGTLGSHGGTCAFNGNPGLSPGTPGFETVILTVPTTPGIYDVVVNFSQEIDCPTALTNYPAGAVLSSQVIGQIAVPIVLYEGGLSDGYIGSGGGVDSICTANLPPGYTNSLAFISISSADYLAIMPALFGIPANPPIVSISNILIANNWADLTDGTIATPLSAAGVTNNEWWSGADDASGSSTDGVTMDCTDWTNNASVDSGNFGDPNNAGPLWVTQNPIFRTCDQVLAVLCVGY